MALSSIEAIEFPDGFSVRRVHFGGYEEFAYLKKADGWVRSQVDELVRIARRAGGYSR